METNENESEWTVAGPLAETLKAAKRLCPPPPGGFLDRHGGGPSVQGGAWIRGENFPNGVVGGHGALCSVSKGKRAHTCRRACVKPAKSRQRRQTLRVRRVVMGYNNYCRRRHYHRRIRETVTRQTAITTSWYGLVGKYGGRWIPSDPPRFPGRFAGYSKFPDAEKAEATYGFLLFFGRKSLVLSRKIHAGQTPPPSHNRL